MKQWTKRTEILQVAAQLYWKIHPLPEVGPMDSGESQLLLANAPFKSSTKILKSPPKKSETLKDEITQVKPQVKPTEITDRNKLEHRTRSQSFSGVSTSCGASTSTVACGEVNNSNFLIQTQKNPFRIGSAKFLIYSYHPKEKTKKQP